MSNEALATYKKYIVEESLVHFLGDERHVLFVLKFLSKGRLYTGEAPDLAIICDHYCLAIEHFEFDCYKNNRRGSENKKEQARVDRAFNAILTTDPDTLFHDEIKGCSSYKQYINNIQKVFSEHYLKISDYKRNLIEKGLVNENMQLKISFLIEDVTPLGSSVCDEKGMYPIVLAHCKEFLELLRQSPDVDYVLACSSTGADQHIWLVAREELNEYEQNSMDYANMQFINFSPQVAGFKFLIPSKS